MMFNFSQIRRCGAVLLASLVAATFGSAQPGLIYKPATEPGAAVLNPSGHGFVSQTTAGFQNNDVAESEIPYHALPQLAIEPTHDVRTGPGGGHTDFVDNGNKETAFMFYDGENILFRIRLAGQSTAAKGYSIFFNTEFELFGPKGGNFSATNPGFQFEVVLETNHGVRIYELGGESGEVAIPRGPPLPVAKHHQRAISHTHMGGETGYFYDFYVPLAALQEAAQEFEGGFDFDAATPFRAAMATITRAQSGITGTISDVNGVNDNHYRSPAQALVDLVKSTPAISLNDLTEGGGGFGGAIEETNSPRISQPVFSGATSVSGSLNEEEGGTVWLHKNGDLIGAVSDVANFSWTLSGIDELVAGDILTARAQAGAKEISAFSAEVVVVSSPADLCPQGITAAPVITGGAQNARGMVGTAPANAKVRVYNSEGVAQMSADTNALHVLANASGDWTFRWCTTANGCMPAGSYFVTAENEGANQCESSYSNPFSNGLTGTTTAPEILSSPVQGDTAVEVANLHSSPAFLHLYVNGSLVAVSPFEVNAFGDENDTFVFAPLVLFAGDEVQARAKAQ